MYSLYSYNHMSYAVNSETTTDNIIDVIETITIRYYSLALVFFLIENSNYISRNI